MPLKKTVADIVAILKKQSAPGQKKITIWASLQAQMEDEGTWDQEVMKEIESIIASNLSKLDKKALVKLYEETDAFMENEEELTNTTEKTMKAALVNELVGLVLDKLDSNYTRSSYFEQETLVNDSEETPKSKSDEDDAPSVEEPDEFDDEDIDFIDDSLFDDEDSFDDDHI
ncbi:MAG: hypothetical protein WC055_07125 [Melioribacteraceae bacterium]